MSKPLPNGTPVIRLSDNLPLGYVITSRAKRSLVHGWIYKIDVPADHPNSVLAGRTPWFSEREITPRDAA